MGRVGAAVIGAHHGACPRVEIVVEGGHWPRQALAVTGPRQVNRGEASAAVEQGEEAVVSIAARDEARWHAEEDVAGRHLAFELGAEGVVERPSRR